MGATRATSETDIRAVSHDHVEPGHLPTALPAARAVAGLVGLVGVGR